MIFAFKPPFSSDQKPYALRVTPSVTGASKPATMWGALAARKLAFGGEIPPKMVNYFLVGGFKHG
jgi:hypothetical protein